MNCNVILMEDANGKLSTRLHYHWLIHFYLVLALCPCRVNFLPQIQITI
jgi:hypothetical protein